MYIFVKILICLTIVKFTLSLIAYDCLHERSNITSVSLLDVGSCEEKMRSKVMTVTRDIQLLQIQEWNLVHVYHCRVEIIRMIFYCGMHSHTSIVAEGTSSYLKDLSSTECSNLHAGKKLFIDGTETISISGNTTLSHRFTMIGYVDNSGNCKGGTYMINNMNYYNVIVQIAVNLQIKDYYTTVQIKPGEVLFNDGTTCKLASKFCIHPTFGFTYWDIFDEDNCKSHSRDVLYQGPANITSVKGELINGAMVSVNSGTSMFNIMIKEPIMMCSHSVFSTLESRIFVIEKGVVSYYFEKLSINPKNIDYNMYLNYKIAYVFEHIQEKLDLIYHKLTEQTCELERKTIKNKLMAARHHPYSFGNIITDEPGYMSIIAGEVLHIAKCQMVEVSLRRDNRCFNNIPVFYNNQSMYLEPFSKTLTNTSNEITCSMILPVMYNLDGEWYSLTPQAIKIKEPHIISPRMKPDYINYTNVNALVNGGIYDAEAMEKYKESLNFPLVRLDANNYVSSRVTGTNLYHNGPYSGNNLISEYNMKAQMKEVVYSVFGWTKSFGAYAGALLGIGMIYKVITKIFSTMMNGATLYQAFGCGFYLLAGIMTSLTHLVFQRKYMKNLKKENHKDLSKAERGEFSHESEPMHQVYDKPNEEISIELHDETVMFNQEPYNRQYPAIRTVKI